MKISISQYLGGTILLAMLGFAFLQPYFYPMDIGFQDLTNILSNPNEIAWFGTDHLGGICLPVLPLLFVFRLAYHCLA